MDMGTYTQRDITSQYIMGSVHNLVDEGTVDERAP